MNNVKLFLGILLSTVFFIGQGCVTIKQGEVGVKRKLANFQILATPKDLRSTIHLFLGL